MISFTVSLLLFMGLSSAGSVSDELARSVRRVAPSVVQLDVRRAEVATEVEEALAAINRDVRFLQVEMLPGNGSGFVVSPGLVATNHHVVSGALAIRATLAGGRVVDARVVGADPERDVALVELVDAPRLPALSFAGEPALGTLVVSAGHPMGKDLTVSMGLISGLGEYDLGIGNRAYILTDSAILRGASGGPLVDTEGRVVGMNVASFQHRQLGFAIPGALVQQTLQRLREGRSGVKFGVHTTDVIGVDDDALRPGVRVDLVVPDSPAQKAGLQGSDVIIAVDGVRTGTGRHVARVLSSRLAVPVEVTVNREHVDWTIPVTPDVPDEPGSLWGAVPVVERAQGLVVQSAHRGLRYGDVIIEANGAAVGSLLDLQVVSTKVVLLTVLRGEHRMFAVVDGSTAG